jgi:hypothetical protein
MNILLFFNSILNNLNIFIKYIFFLILFCLKNLNKLILKYFFINFLIFLKLLKNLSNFLCLFVLFFVCFFISKYFILK